MINKFDINYLNFEDLNTVEKTIKEYTDEVKKTTIIPEYSDKSWVINELPYIQEINRIENGIKNLGEYYAKPTGWLPTKEWLKPVGNALKLSELRQEIKLFDAIDKTVNNVRINGYTRQITTTGDNFYTKDFSSVSSLIREEDNDWFSYSYDHSAGTATTYSNLFTKASDLLKINTEYYCVVELKDVEITGNVTMVITDGVYSNEQFKTGFKIEKDDLQSKTIVIKELTTKDNFDGTTLLLRSFFALRARSKISLKFRISLRGKTQTEDNFVYEPFSNGIPSPSPDYPQEVEVARGNNFLDITKTQIGKAWNNTTNSSRAIIITKVKPNTKYYVSYQNISNIEGLYIFGRTNVDDDTSTIGNAQITTNPKEVITTENTNYIGIQINKTNITQEDVNNIGLQLKKDNNTEYEPYNSIVAKSNGENLFDKDSIKNVVGGKNDNGIITSNNLTTPTVLNLTAFYNPIKVKRGEIVYISADIKLNEGSTGSFSTLNDNVRPGWKALSNPQVNTYFQRYQTSYTYQEDAEINRILIQMVNLKGTITVKNIKISKNFNIDYKPYQESKQTYSLNDNFVAEQDYIQDNKLYKNVTKVVLDGSEEWKDNWQNSATPDYIQFYLPADFLSNNYKPANVMPAFSNRFKVYGTVWIYNEECIGLNMSTTKSLQIKFKKSRISNLSELKQWLSENPVEVYYQLATPNIIDLEPSGELKTYKDYTNISNNKNTEMQVQYYSTEPSYGYAIKSYDYQDWNRWVNNLNLFKSQLSDKINIWNGPTYIDWDTSSNYEWEE